MITVEKLLDTMYKKSLATIRIRNIFSPKES